MIVASLLFAGMGVCVKVASARHGAGKIVLYRSLVGLLLMTAVLRWRAIGWRSSVPAMHFWHNITGATALRLWFQAIAKLPLATAMTLNAMSSVWIALFLIGGAVLLSQQQGGSGPIDARLVAAVLTGFGGVALVLRPTIAQGQLWHGLVGLGSGLIAAMAYQQVTALGCVGEPGERVVLYFSITGVVFGIVVALFKRGLRGHTPAGVAVQYLGIVFSFGFGVLLFDEQLTLWSTVGVVLIVAAGVAAALLRARPHSKGPAAPPET